MAIKTYSGLSAAGIPSTKIRAEQIKGEDFGNLAHDLEALRGQIKDIIGAADYKENVSGFDVQLVELNPHLSGSIAGDTLKVKQKMQAVGDAQFDASIDVAVEATLASAIIEDVSATHIMFAGTGGAVEGSASLKWDGSDLVAASAKVSDLTDGRVVYAGADGALVDSSEMTFGAGGLTLAKDLAARSGSFSGDVTIAGDLLVQGNTVTVDVGTLLVEDKNVVIAKDASGANLDGAGIFLGSEAGESLSWNHADTKWVASDKFAAETLQATDLSEAIVWADASGNLVEISAADHGAAINGLLAEGTGVGFALDAGTGVTTISIGQPVATSDSVEFAYVTGSNLTASRLMASDANKVMVSADLASWVAGTANQVIVTDGGDGSITLSAPQDMHTGASPEFAALNIGTAHDLLAVDAGANFKMQTSGIILFQDAQGTYELAKTGEYASFDAAFTATSLVGALLELRTAANNVATKKASYVVTGAEVASGTDIAASLSPNFLSELTGANEMIFVNGQLQQGGGSDYTRAAGALSFAYNLQVGDVVVVKKA